MKTKRFVFITGNDSGQVGIVEWRVHGNINMTSLDVVAIFHEAMKHNKRWDSLMDEPSENLIYAFYPSGNPGLIEFTEDVTNVAGDKHITSRVTAYQTAHSGMVSM